MTDYDGVSTESATDELRRMLDERGVEYTGTHPAFTAWWGNHDLYWSAMEVYDGELDLGTNMSSVSPEQAIAATLGSGTCEADETDTIKCWVKCKDEPSVEHMELIHVMECSECGHTYEHVNGDYEFCPRCGRRIVQ